MMLLIALVLFSLSSSVEGTAIYDARLSGSAVHQGTVEVLTYQGWVGICSYSWDSSDSRVLCRQLGYEYSSYSSTPSGGTLQRYFSIWCTGREAKISQCSHSFVREDTSCTLPTVYCAPCTNTRVQLRDGVVPEAGTVEYCVSGQWKAVCDYRWDVKEAFVVCRQLGYPTTGAISYQNSYFGNRPIHSGTYFNCFGNESSLGNCQTSSTSSCDSVRDAAGVYCRGDIITDLCINGQIRLVGGRDMSEGRVEVCSNGVWGSIYRGYWDSLDARVACRQLGLSHIHSLTRIEVLDIYGSYNNIESGTGPIVYANLNCDGTESTFTDCSVSSSYNFAYSHSSDAGLRCNRIAVTNRFNCANGDVRLANGSTPYEGRVELCYDGVWGSICDISWDYWDAAIVCQQMGFQGANATALTNSYFGDGTGPYHLSNVGCRGDERTLLQCSYGRSTIGYHTCSPGNDAGVRCDALPCSHGEVRLFGGYTDVDGAAEVCINGRWGDICDDGVSDQATLARIFCRQLTGRESASFSSSCCSNQRNTGNITLYGISCSDNSGTFLQDCSYQLVSGYSTGTCNLREELIIGCYEQSNCTNGDIRLRGGNSTWEGRVEVCSQGTWGGIAIDYNYHPFLIFQSWNTDAAVVVCKQLGHPWEWAIAVSNNLFGKGNTRNVVRHSDCTGTETTYNNCSKTTVSSFSYENYPSAGVICQGNMSAPTECEHGNVRLVNGSHQAEGRVEVCARGYWAIACENSWNILQTEIVCKQLQLPTSGSEYASGSPFDSNYQLPLVEVNCLTSTGYANNISGCQISTQLNYRYYRGDPCNHRRNIGIYCQERTQLYYSIAMDVSPAQEIYDIGSQVTFNCTVFPKPIPDGDRTSSIEYRWYSTYGAVTSGFTTANTLSTSIPASHPYFATYYCQPYRNGRPLGTQKITLKIKELLRKSVARIKASVESSISLEVEAPSVSVLNGLLNLTWYHNGSVVTPMLASRYTIRNMNKTLTITNFTSTETGMYVVQFNQFFVHPYNEHCKEEIMSLLRHYPVLSPVVFCVNLAEENCPKIKGLEQQISITLVDSNLRGTLDTITIKATGTVLNSKELRHSSIQWYRNGRSISTSSSTSLSSPKKDQNTLSLSQELKISNVTYEDTGSFEVLLIIDTNTYTRENTQCQPYYDRFIATHLRRYIILAQEQVDIGYYKGLTFSVTADKKAASRNEGATMSCEASLQFPPFSMLSFIKNGLTVASTTSGQLQIDIKSINANPFGLYICQLNASGEMFQKSLAFKEQASLRIVFNTDNQQLCTDQLAKTALEDELASKIASECQCTFQKSDLYNSTTTCDNGELTYTANVIYANDDGYETASIVVDRLVRQAPFTMTVSGMRVKATSACSECDTTASLSPAVGGGLFVAGFVVAALLALILIIVVIIVMKKRSATSDGIRQKPETSGDPVRYASSVKGKNAESAKLQTTNVSFQYQKEDYEEMNPQDQPIYEETF